MRALISGIGGFAGAHLAGHLLESGDEVIGCSSRGTWPVEIPAQVTDNATIFRWDISQEIPTAIRRQISEFAPEAVYHLAAISVPSACGNGEPTPKAVAVNVQGTKAVLELVGTLASRPRLVFASSCYVYAPVSAGQPKVREDAPLGAQRGYAKSKLQAERLITAAAKTGRVDAIIARAFQHSGPRQSPQMILPDWASQLAASSNEPIRVSCRDAYLDLSDVRDVVRAYRALVVDGKPRTVYNVGSGICRRSGDLLQQLLDISKSGRDVVEIDPGRRQHPIADVSRIMAHTKWKPHIGIRETLEDILEYWQRRNESP
ncbi:MAG TPA: NAD-dependent epimerase/dehydratase family protein [Pirellulaceae bacterium]|nr:NAD-dependent epimerase/dehydratase family protein [Pirellulaceae bacterium]